MVNFYTQSSPQTLSTPHHYQPSNEQAAWFALVYTAACFEGTLPEESRETLCKLITSKQLYKGHEIINYYYELMKVIDKTEAKEIIRKSAKMVSPECAPTLFSIVTETLLAKGYLTEKEEDLLEFIGKNLNLDKSISGKILEVLLIKNKGNCVYN